MGLNLLQRDLERRDQPGGHLQKEQLLLGEGGDRHDHQGGFLLEIRLGLGRLLQPELRLVSEEPDEIKSRLLRGPALLEILKLDEERKQSWSRQSEEKREADLLTLASNLAVLTR